MKFQVKNWLFNIGLVIARPIKAKHVLVKTFFSLLPDSNNFQPALQLIESFYALMKFQEKIGFLILGL